MTRMSSAGMSKINPFDRLVVEPGQGVLANILFSHATLVVNLFPFWFCILLPLVKTRQ